MLEPIVADSPSALGAFSVSSKALLTVNVLDSDECSVPFNKKSELTGISVTSLMPSVRMARMEPLSGAGII